MSDEHETIIAVAGMVVNNPAHAEDVAEMVEGWQRGRYLLVSVPTPLLRELLAAPVCDRCPPASGERAGG